MKRILFLLIAWPLFCEGQTAIPMAQQPALTYYEDFSNIMSWTNNFQSGAGAQYFSGVAPGGSGAIPDATHTTHNTQVWAIGSSGGIQKDTINYKLMMLATGTSDNTSAAAFDVFMDFTGINAGSLSFDWESVNNNTGNRNGSLRVYASVDGVNFSEIAQVLNITNNAPTSGSVVSAALPASFNNNANARIRFYYYNGTGGTTGSRPKIRLLNLKLTASGNPCITPASQPTNLNFGTVTATTIQGSFTHAVPQPDEYLVIATLNNSLTSNPVDSFVYNPGDNVGDGTVIYRGGNNSFTATGLDPSTNYKFFIFSLNIYCNGIIRYDTLNPLIGTQSTIAGPPCVTPPFQPTNLQFSGITPNTIQGSFDTASGTDEYLVVVSTNNVLSANPVDGTIYHAGDNMGGGTVVQVSGNNFFTATGLNPNTTYYFFIFSANDLICSNGPKYNTVNPLNGSQDSGVLLNCSTPPFSATNLVLHPNTDYINGWFNPYPVGTDGYLVVMSTSSSLSSLPVDATDYNIGDNIGGGTVLSKGNNYSFTAGGLATTTSYYFFIFSYNNICIGDVKYRTADYLTGSATTTNTPAFNYYFGNLHAHSSYSDGNKDNAALTPADDYDFAKNALCMDFLGISEHNHYTASNNPGMLLSYYQQGLNEAAAYTAAHPGFLALYGMEWGVLSNGGHVLVYGIDSLLGWETLNGSPNYDIYVAKSDYNSPNGLFRKVNDFAGNKAFATLAHPSSHDFGELFYNPYNASADSAIVGIAVESGPASSSNTSYSEPAGYMNHIQYYEWALSKGYHLAPQIDHDNHYTTFGRTAYTRTAVVAPSLSRTDFFEAMNRMRFYATEDCDTRAGIEIYGQMMGNSMTHSFAPAITINAVDPTSPSVVPIIKLMYGIPGSNINPVPIKIDTGYVLNYTDINLPDSSNAYYYADIMIGGNRTVTAPVWYRREDTLLPAYVPEVINEWSRMMNIVENPVKDELRIEIYSPRAQQVRLQITSVAGHAIDKRSLKAVKGLQQISIPVRELQPGMYIIEALFHQETVRRKFVVVR